MREKEQTRPETKQNKDGRMRRRREYEHERKGAGAEREGKLWSRGGERV